MNFPEYCTLPHIMAFIMTASTRQLSIFLQQNLVAEMMAGAYLKAEGSEKDPGILPFHPV